MYFRIYRVFKSQRPGCRECGFIRELKELLRKFQENQTGEVRGSNSPDDRVGSPKQ